MHIERDWNRRMMNHHLKQSTDGEESYRKVFEELFNPQVRTSYTSVLRQETQLL